MVARHAQVGIILIGLMAVASAIDIPVVWKIPSSMKPYNTYFIQVGDSLTYNWQGLHGVYRLSSDSCPSSFADTGPNVLAAEATGGSYTWHATAPGTYYLACQVGSHCSEGMLQEIVVGSGPALAPSAMAPMVPSMAPAASGDSEGDD